MRVEIEWTRRKYRKGPKDSNDGIFFHFGGGSAKVTL